VCVFWAYAFRVCFGRMLWAYALCVYFESMFCADALGMCFGRMFRAYAFGVCFQYMASERMCLGVSLWVRGFGRMSLGV